MSKEARMHKSLTARKKRKQVKEIVFKRTDNFFAKMRRKRQQRSA